MLIKAEFLRLSNLLFFIIMGIYTMNQNYFKQKFKTEKVVKGNNYNHLYSIQLI